MSNIHASEFIEEEWWSNCCTAPPLYDIHYDEEYDAEPIGLCMQCRENAVFNQLTEEDREWQEQHLN